MKYQISRIIRMFSTSQLEYTSCHNTRQQLPRWVEARNPVIKAKRVGERETLSHKRWRGMSSTRMMIGATRTTRVRQNLFSLSPSNLPRPILGPMRRLLRLLASIWTPCRSGGWLRARAPRVAMTTTIAPPLTEVLNRTLLATWPHMFSALLQPLLFQAPLAPTESGEDVLTLWKTHRNPRFSLYCWSWVTQILWQVIPEYSGFSMELKSHFVNINPFNYYNTIKFYLLIK